MFPKDQFRFIEECYLIRVPRVKEGKNLISADRGKNFYFHNKIILIDFFTPWKSHVYIMLHKNIFITNYVNQI